MSRSNSRNVFYHLDKNLFSAIQKLRLNIHKTTISPAVKIGLSQYGNEAVKITASWDVTL
jgi:hypothetical protein